MKLLMWKNLFKVIIAYLNDFGSKSRTVVFGRVSALGREVLWNHPVILNLYTQHLSKTQRFIRFDFAHITSGILRLLNFLVNIFALWPYVGLFNRKCFFDSHASLNNDAKEVEWMVALLNNDLVR